MRTEAQTSIHLLMAGIISVFNGLLILVTIAMSWEPWTVVLTAVGCLVVWWLHIGRVGSEMLYENICGGLLMMEFFFFGVHESSFFDIPLLACVLIVILSLLSRKRLLYLTAALYVLLLAYHFLLLGTISPQMKMGDALRMLIGVAAVAGVATVGRYRINRRRREQDKYLSMQEQLETAVQQNADFLSNVSHELRTPVNMVIGISEVALGKTVPPQIREDIESIKLAGKRLSGQINNILDYTEIVENTLTAVNEPYTITSVINDVITMTTLQNSGHELEMVFDMDPKIPSVLVGDAEKISHVLKILLENSLKFTEEGGISLYAGYRQESYGVNLTFDISDTGIGMTSSQLDQMIDDFYQADSGSRRYVGGLGLGIPIARGLLHAMGGFVHFESKEQQGLQVHIVIPQGVEDDTPSIAIPDASRLCIACYFRPERYSREEVKRYYDNMILHLVEGLGIEGYQAHNFEGLLKLQREHDLTHIFIAQSEYMANPPYYEELSESVQVAVIADKDFGLDEDSKLLVLRKPFFALTIVNLLSGQERDSNPEENRIVAGRPFTCVGVRALAVDDEEMNLVVAKGVLGSYGMQVDTCLSGKAAVERCMEVSYDIIFLDHMMPGFDGVETLRRIREVNNGAYKELPVIALTANTISGAREMFRNEGFSEFIPKPIERSVLERVLRRALPQSCIQYEGDHGEGKNLSVRAAMEREKASGENRAAQGPSCYENFQGEDSASNALSEMHSGIGGDVEEEPATAYGSLVRAGINVGLGLDYCSGEEGFYLEMLRMFCNQEEEKRKEIESYYEEGNWTDYAIKVHALKSTSLTIGAEELSSQAKALEQAGKEENVEYIRENHSRLLQTYREVCQSIADL